jgi:hypothetical protein
MLMNRRFGAYTAVLLCGFAIVAGIPSRADGVTLTAGSAGAKPTVTDVGTVGPPPVAPLSVPMGSCSGAPVSAGPIASIQTQLNAQAGAQDAAVTAAQNFIPVMNARAQATVTRMNYLLTADPIDPAQAQALAADQASADAAYQAALPAWTTAFTVWSEAYGALKGLLDANAMRAGEFGCYGIAVPQTSPRVYRCGNVFSGSASLVDSSGSLFRQLQQYAGTNYYFCALQQ